MVKSNLGLGEGSGVEGPPLQSQSADWPGAERTFGVKDKEKGWGGESNNFISQGAAWPV